MLRSNRGVARVSVTWLVVVASVFWLGILLVLTLSDYLTRSWMTFG